jgi:hypothetical protein
MPISISDQKNKLEEYLFKNSLITLIFGNIIIVSIIIVLSNIFILYLIQSEDSGFIKIFLWMFVNTLLLLILHNKTIKLEYKEQIKTKGDIEFKDMMENNTNNLVGNNEISGRSEFKETDIIKFLG